MSRRKDGWKRLVVSPKVERDKSPDPQPGEGRDPNAKPEEKKKKRRKSGIPQEGGHSQGSISEQENMLHEGGHSQSSNGVNPHKPDAQGGGHSQSSKGKHMHYGHFGRYNEQMDF